MSNETYSAIDNVLMTIVHASFTIIVLALAVIASIAAVRFALGKLKFTL